MELFSSFSRLCKPSVSNYMLAVVLVWMVCWWSIPENPGSWVHIWMLFVHELPSLLVPSHGSLPGQPPNINTTREFRPFESSNESTERPATDQSEAGKQSVSWFLLSSQWGYLILADISVAQHRILHGRPQKKESRNWKGWPKTKIFKGLLQINNNFDNII